MKFHWRLHSALLRGREDDFLSHIKSQGDTVQFVSGRVSSIDAPDPSANDTPGIALTTIEDAQHLLSKGLWRSPQFLYFNPLKYNVSYWLPRINPLIPTLNQHCEFVPAGLISRLKSKVPEGGSLSVQIPD